MSSTTIKYAGIDFDVEYYHQPFEPMVMYYSDGSGYPGCPEQVKIEEITHQGTDFTELLEDKFEEIEELILENIHE